MEKVIKFNAETCTQCGLCAEVCPNRILILDKSGNMAALPELVPLCFECKQCMAVCKTQSIFVNGFSYEKDFFPLPEVHNGANTFQNLIHTRRAIRNFKDQAVPKALLENIVEAISYAPPSFPTQKFKLVVIGSKSPL
ncbi:MAG: nitroreductase family protein [Prolixibacteraceae bacterium]